MERFLNVKLTERELEVLKLLSQGLEKSEIAERLFVSVHTVKAHTESIYRKFSVNNKVQAIIFAIKNEIIEI